MASQAQEVGEVTCPLCGSEESKLYAMAPSHWGPDVLRVTRCPRCEMIFTNPRPSTDTIETWTATHDVAYTHLFVEDIERARWVARFQIELGSSYTTGRRLLDFGCGRGITVHEGAQQGWDAFGIDLNQPVIDAANRHWGFDRLRPWSLDQFVASSPVPFDFILANQVVEHLCDPVGICRTLAGLLRPGGVLFVDVPNARQLGERLRRGKCLSPTGHLNHFTKKTLRQLMTRIGLQVVYATGAPSFVAVYGRLGLGQHSYALARVTQRILPGIGTGVCAIGRKAEDRSGPVPKVPGRG